MLRFHFESRVFKERLVSLRNIYEKCCNKRVTDKRTYNVNVYIMRRVSQPTVNK